MTDLYVVEEYHPDQPDDGEIILAGVDKDTAEQYAVGDMYQPVNGNMIHRPRRRGYQWRAVPDTSETVTVSRAALKLIVGIMDSEYVDDWDIQKYGIQYVDTVLKDTP